jgi:hypothetical protein
VTSHQCAAAHRLRNTAIVFIAQAYKTSRHVIGRHCCIYLQTEGHLFDDHLISESVSVTPWSVIEASAVLCSVFMTRVSQCPISLRSQHPVSVYLLVGTKRSHEML